MTSIFLIDISIDIDVEIDQTSRITQHYIYMHFKYIQVSLVKISWVFLAFLAASSAKAIDLQPGDATAPTPGLQSLQLSYLNAERVAVSNAKVNQTQAQIRYARAFELNAQPALFYIHTGTGKTETAGSLTPYPSDNGAIDTTLVLAYWPYVNRANKTYFAMAGYLVAPTGSYSSERVFNMGENRYKWAGQVAYQTRIAPALDWMSAFDILWFGSNDESRQSLLPNAVVGQLDQKALYSAQTGLLYDLNSNYSLAASYFYSKGGETIFRGAAQNNEMTMHRYQLSLIGKYSFGRVSLQYGQDIDSNASFEDKHRIFLRLTKYFQ